MSLDVFNLKLQRVPYRKELEFFSSVPEAGSPVYCTSRQYLVVGDGVNKGGNAIASKDWVLYAIKLVELTDTTDNLSAK